MTEISFTIPHRQVPAVAEAAIALYADAAEAIRRAIGNSEPRLAAAEAIRRNPLPIIDRLLVPLHWGTPPDSRDSRLDIEPTLLVHLLRTAANDATDALTDACAAYLNGGQEAPLLDTLRHVTTLFELLDASRQLARASAPTEVQLDDATAQIVLGEAVATGAAPETIVADAVYVHAGPDHGAAVR